MNQPRTNVRSWVMTIASVAAAVAALMTLFILIADGRYVERSDVPNIRKDIANDIQKGDDGVREQMRDVHEQIDARIKGNLTSIGQLHGRLNSDGR